MLRQSPKKIIGISITIIFVITMASMNIKSRNEVLQNETDKETLFAVYIDGEKVNQLPSKEDRYVFDEEKSFCNNGISISWSYKQWTANIDFTDYKIQNKERTYCNLYFKKQEQYQFMYTGSEQEFIVPKDGYYQIELWGAGSLGRGAYTSGVIELQKSEKIYFYIGEAAYVYNGIDMDYLQKYNIIFNNGTRFVNVNSVMRTRAGDGATDIRLVNGSWNSFESLKSRIMVAAGSGGYYLGGAGGGLVGYSGTSNSSGSILGVGGGQLLAGSSSGGFGYGAQGNATGSTDEAGCGGSGYYGGGAGYHYEYSAGGGGGSSFISGHNGCDAIKEESTANNIIHTGKPNHYSGYIFESTKMIDGKGYSWTSTKQNQEAMPNPKGGYYNLGVGHTGNGYARVTYLGR